MPTLAFTSYISTSDERDHSHITDLGIYQMDGQTILLATTRYDGIISSWNISDNAMRRIDSADHAGTLSAGVMGSLQTVTVNGTQTLLTGGYTNGLGLYSLSNSGHIGNGTALSGTTGVIGGLQHGITLQFSTGNQGVYGGIVGQAGIGRAFFDVNGNLISTRVFPDTNNTFADEITAMATAEVAGQTYLFSASAIENGVTSWTVPKNGVISHADSMGVDDGLWIAGPSALATAQLQGKTYLLVGSADSNSISIMEVGADGAMIIRDHMLDTRDTRFAGITTIEVAQHKGQTYVIAGGRDDGISIFQLVPGGQLVHRATRADAVNMGIANVSDIVANSTPIGLEIFVASSSEFGITALRFDAGATGDVRQATDAGGVLTGTNGADVLRGMGGDDTLRAGAGDDILVDGTGDDVLTGGDGADVFVFSFDGSYDTITDFTLGQDRLDLSGWPMLRSVSQLTISMTPDGMQIIYGDETLIIQSADGKPIDHRQLTNNDIIGSTRMPQVSLPGYAGPYTPDPDLPGRFVGPDPSRTKHDDVFGYAGQTIQGQFFYKPRGAPANGEVYFGGKGFDKKSTGQGNDRLYGGGGKDTLIGGKGADRLHGGDWRDRLFGGKGDDLVYGNGGNDVLYGGDGRDRLFGGAGDDVLYGKNSDDILMGYESRDKLVGGRGNDRIYGGRGADTLMGGTGHDLLDGGTGNDTASGGKGRDILYGHKGADRLSGMAGTDKIFGQNGHDKIYGGSHFDIIKGGDGNDKIWGDSGNDDLQGSSGKDLIYGGDGYDGISGGQHNDTLKGGTGKDEVAGGKGHDKIWGGTNRDALYGNSGKDLIYGGDGGDHIWGNTNSDTLSGGNGDDVIKGGEGHDNIAGGRNDDTLFGDENNDILSGNKGRDTLFGGSGDDKLRGQEGNDHLYGGKGTDQVSGGGGDDTLYGGDGADHLIGYTGNDSITGGQGNDDIYGGTGTDRLNGNKGNDTLYGGSGSDTFHFTHGQDLIADFDQTQDHITLDYDLWEGTLAISDVLLLFGDITGSTVTLDFDNGHVLTITGVTDYDSFADSLMIV